MEIIPAILPKNFEEIVDKTSSVKDFVKMVQVDICDGQFVPSQTWPYGERDNVFERILKEDEGLPFWQELNYEFDLMVNFRRVEDIDQWVNVGATRIVFHAESNGDILEMMKNIRGKVEIGLAINIDTPVSILEAYRDIIDFVQIMGIDHIGMQGQVYDPKAKDKIKEVRKLYPELPISVDGGVSLENAKELLDCGATRLVVGSGIYGADDIVQEIKKLQAIGK